MIDSCDIQANEIERKKKITLSGFHNREVIGLKGITSIVAFRTYMLTRRAIKYMSMIEFILLP